MIDFEKTFHALTGYYPFRWQKRLYETCFLKNDIPSKCILATGLGKTNVILIWLIALAAQTAMGQEKKLPRRLVYIVNRRTVVDQATEIVNTLRITLDQHKNTPELRWLYDALLQLGANRSESEAVLAISTLRGELADNEEWKADAARPAIIVGTIDMIGSKMLFQGYGDNYKLRPHHAGLIGQDTFVVHDEAHLTPAFSAMLKAVQAEQINGGDASPIHLMELSATVTTQEDEKPFALIASDKEEALINQRINAQKHLRFHILDGEKSDEMEKKIVELALRYQHDKVKVLIYVESPATVKKIVDLLKKSLGKGAEQRIAILTGTMRGYERDQMVRENPVYRAFLNASMGVEETRYLVSTSAGEVGIDIDADHLISDLSTLDSMIQRFGRVNRRGGKDRIAYIDVVFKQIVEFKDGKEQKLDAKEKACLRTLELLKALPCIELEAETEIENSVYNACPDTIGGLMKDAGDAVSPKPSILPLSDILFDAWALTSGYQPFPNAPEVHPYLHGLEPKIAETYVAWRSEISYFFPYDKSKKSNENVATDVIDEETIKDWFSHCRIESQERLRQPTYQLVDELKKFTKYVQSIPVVLLLPNGEIEKINLAKILEDKKQAEKKLAFATLVFAPELGGLSDWGLLDDKCVNKPKQIMDVAEYREKRARRLLAVQSNDVETKINVTNCAGKRFELLDWAQSQTPRQFAAQLAKQQHWALVYFVSLYPQNVDSEDENVSGKYLVLLSEPRRAVLENPDSTGYLKQPTVDEHCVMAEQWATQFVKALALPKQQAEAVMIAARWHDRGKDRRIWQRSIYNYTAPPFAKSGSKGMDGAALGGYRHELGSLLEAMRDETIRAHSEADLILHLIAVHHGWARPHFLEKAHDETFTTEDNDEAVVETMQRFGRLQLRYGRWGLAWLECLMRCTDILSSNQIAVSDLEIGG